VSLIKKQLAFTVSEYCSRLSRARDGMAQSGLAALIVHSPENICYLSGYHTSGYYYLQALIVTAEHDPFLVTRLFEQRNIDAFSWLEREANGVPFTDTESPIEKRVGASATRSASTSRPTGGRGTFSTSRKATRRCSSRA
jgi:Xaa-Pro aminopeptidase